MQKICDIYKSSLVDDLYIFIEKQAGLDDVPGALMDKFGVPVHVMTMLITPDKSMARVSGEQILSAINDNGFYLQLPKQLDEDLRVIADKNAKLTKRGF